MPEREKRLILDPYVGIPLNERSSSQPKKTTALSYAKKALADPNMTVWEDTIMPGLTKPFHEYTKREQENINRQIDEDMARVQNEYWRSIGIDPNDKAAQTAHFNKTTGARILKFKEELKAKGKRTECFETPGWFERRTDTEINKFLFALGFIYWHYTHPIWIYYTSGTIVVFYFLVFLYKLYRITNRLKVDFRPDPKSRYSDEYQRQQYDGMKAYIAKKKEIKDKILKKLSFKK